MKKLIISSLLGLCLTTPAFANDPQLERVLEKQVKNKLERCFGGVNQVENIGSRYFATYTWEGSYDKNHKQTGSLECSGNTSGSGLAELSYNNGRYSVVNVDMFENNADFAYISNMSISDDGIATLDTVTYGRNDTQHNPRDQYQIKLRLVDMKVLSNQFIGRAPE